MNNNTNTTQSIVQYMSGDAVQKNITQTLGRRANQFVTSVASLVNSNTQLQDCDQKSILSACLIAASLDLPLNQNLGFAYVIPYNKTITEMVIDPKTGKEKPVKTVIKQAQFQMGWKGFVQLAQRSGQLSRINTTDIREGEIKEDDLVTGEMVIERAEEREKLPIIGYLAYMQLKNGFAKQFYMTKDELEAHAKKYSASYRSNSKGTNVWRDDFDSMAKKTVIKLLLSKYAPMTSELAKAIEADQAVEEDGSLLYLDNRPIDPKQLAHEKEVERVRQFIENAKTVDELDQCRDHITKENEELFSSKFDELANDGEKSIDLNADQEPEAETKKKKGADKE